MIKKKNIIKIIILVLSFILILSMIIMYNIVNKNDKNDQISTSKLEETTINDDRILMNLTCEASYSSDPTNPENLLEGIDNHILKVKIVEILDGEILPKMKYYNNPFEPCTPIKVELIDNIYGDSITLKDNIIYMSGGNIKISNLINNLDEVDINRMGIDTLSKEDKENKYIKYSREYSYDMKVGNEYIIIVGKMDDGIYKIVEEGCGIFVEDSSSNAMSKKAITGISLKNVITNDKIEQETLVEKAKEKSVEINEINKVNNNINK